jgi:hypothetical protein
MRIWSVVKVLLKWLLDGAQDAEGRHPAAGRDTDTYGSVRTLWCSTCRYMIVISSLCGMIYASAFTMLPSKGRLVNVVVR